MTTLKQSEFCSLFCVMKSMTSLEARLDSSRFHLQQRKWSPAQLEPKMPFNDIFAQDENYYFIFYYFSFLKVLSVSFKWRFG